MLLAHTLHSYLNTVTGHASEPVAPTPQKATTDIYNKEHHLQKAYWARIRKLWLRGMKLTQIPN